MSIPRFKSSQSKLLPVAVIAVALAGCAGHSDFMTKLPQGAPAVAPVSDHATVAFIRDSGFGYAVNFSIIDQAGNLLGDAVARSHFALQVPAGRYFVEVPTLLPGCAEAQGANGHLFRNKYPLSVRLAEMLKRQR